jgi:hypothetical protein
MKHREKTIVFVAVVMLLACFTAIPVLAQSTAPGWETSDMKAVQPAVVYADSLQAEPSPEAGFDSIAHQLVIAYHYAGFGVWDVYWPEFDIDTIEALEVGKIYLIYVDSDCVLQYGSQTYELSGPDWNFIYWAVEFEPTPAIDYLLVTADHCYLMTESWGYKVGQGQNYHIECILSDTSGGVSYEWSCTVGYISEVSQDGSMITWIAPDTTTRATVTVAVSDVVGNTVSESVLLYVVTCSKCEFGC